MTGKLPRPSRLLSAIALIALCGLVGVGLFAAKLLVAVLVLYVTIAALWIGGWILKAGFR